MESGFHDWLTLIAAQFWSGGGQDITLIARYCEVERGIKELVESRPHCEVTYLVTSKESAEFEDSSMPYINFSARGCVKLRKIAIGV